MAGSKYAYVKSFELPDPILPNTFIVFRVDGHSFHRFADVHSFTKPNDDRALRLMDCAARNLMSAHSDIVLAFGESDEFSFLLRRSTLLFNRRHAKILSTLTSEFTSSYVFHWREHFPDTSLAYPPSFDGRIVLYPGEKEVRDYFSWRQVDTHINNLYNTTFWALVQQGGQTTAEAHATLRGTISKDKQEILFTRFGINYNTLPARFRKGSVFVREEIPELIAVAPPNLTDAATADSSSKVEIVSNNVEDTSDSAKSTMTPTLKPPHQNKKTKPQTVVQLLHVDVVQDGFWNSRRYILNE